MFLFQKEKSGICHHTQRGDRHKSSWWNVSLFYFFYIDNVRRKIFNLTS